VQDNIGAPELAQLEQGDNDAVEAATILKGERRSLCGAGTEVRNIPIRQYAAYRCHIVFHIIFPSAKWILKRRPIYNLNMGEPSGLGLS
jgi:hypothetical protein